MLLLVFIHILGLLSAALTNLGADLTGILSYLSSEQREFIIFLLPYSFCLHQIVQVQPVKERITKLPDCRGWLIADASLLLIPFPPLPPTPTHWLPKAIPCNCWQNERWTLLHYAFSTVVILSDEYAGKMTQCPVYFHPSFKKLIYVNVPKPVSPSIRYLGCVPISSLMT